MKTLSVEGAAQPALARGVRLAEPVLRDAGFFVLRTPLLAFDDFTAWAEGTRLSTAADTPEALEEAWVADRVRLRHRLAAWVQHPAVRQAIYVASISLYESLSVWIADPESNRGQRVERALVRYFARMTSRATPFGLFAGISLGTFGSRCRLEIDELSAHQRCSRLDMDYLWSLTEALVGSPELAQQISFISNDSVYRVGDRYRYVEARVQNRVRSYHLSSVEWTEPIAQTLARARSGARRAELAAELVATDPELELGEATEFIEGLIACQLLVPQLTPVMSGESPVARLISDLESVPAGRSSAAVLRRIQNDLETIDRTTLPQLLDPYHAVAAALDELPGHTEGAGWLQVDMRVSSRAVSLPQAVADEIVRGAGVLNRIFTNRAGLVSRFATAFRARYDDREVPLLEVLDEDIGIGWKPQHGAGGEPLLEGIQFPQKEVAPGSWKARDALLLRKLEAALHTGAEQVVLDEADVAALGGDRPEPVRPGMSMCVSVVAASEEAVDHGDYRLLCHALGGSSGVSLLSRFCHLDPELDRRVAACAREEETLEPDATMAEVIHLPHGHVANVLVRPVLRSYEIPYLSRSALPSDRQLPASDLLVSVRPDGSVHLRSRRLGCEVIPRLDTAHAFDLTNEVPLYGFLGSIQHHGKSLAVRVGWGEALDGARYLPRLVIGRWIIALARWRLDRHWIQRLQEKRPGPLARVIRELRAEYRLPRFVTSLDNWKHGKHSLSIDLENALSVESFVDMVRGESEAVVTELLPGTEELPAHGPSGRVRHEIVVPMLARRPTRGAGASLAEAAPGSAEPPGIRRSFSVGDEWLYIKLYTGMTTADELLTTVVAPVVDEVLASGAADGWFFLRYGDPDWHLRVRFHGTGDRLLREVLPRLRASAQPCTDDGRIWRFQCDTYEREVERYGGPQGIVRSEQLFRHDSDAALSILRSGDPDVVQQLRWRLALRGAHLLLEEFGLSLDERIAHVEHARRSLREEFRVDQSFDRQIGNRFRRTRAELDALLAPTVPAEHPLASGFAALAERGRRIAPVVAELRDDPGVKVPLRQLILSHVHLSCNRLLRASQRHQELTIYELLARLYQSSAARAR
jgi:thiopeptide-type bacteriocin biosynthesis protein